MNELEIQNLLIAWTILSICCLYFWFRIVRTQTCLNFLNVWAVTIAVQAIRNELILSFEFIFNSAIREVGWQEATLLARERTYQGVIVLIQSEEGRRLRLVGCLYWMSRLPHAGSYAYDGTGVNQLRLPGPAPDIRAWFQPWSECGVGI